MMTSGVLRQKRSHGVQARRRNGTYRRLIERARVARLCHSHIQLMKEFGVVDTAEAPAEMSIPLPLSPTHAGGCINVRPGCERPNLTRDL